MSVCECPGDSLDLKPIQEDLNIMNMNGSWRALMAVVIFQSRFSNRVFVKFCRL